MDNPHVDFLAILIAAVVYLIIGLVWYSPLVFGNVWRKLCGFDKNFKRRKFAFLSSLIASLVAAYVLGFFETFLGVTTVSDGMFVGFLVWIGFIATTMISRVIWSRSPFQLFLIDGGYRLLGYLVMGGILGA
jgi:hypothetical protein